MSDGRTEAFTISPSLKHGENGYVLNIYISVLLDKLVNCNRFLVRPDKSFHKIDLNDRERDIGANLPCADLAYRMTIVIPGRPKLNVSALSHTRAFGYDMFEIQ